MGVGAGALVVIVNLFKVAPDIAMTSLVLYLLLGSLVIGRYCIAHEDEIPTRASRRESHPS